MAGNSSVALELDGVELTDEARVGAPGGGSSSCSTRSRRSSSSASPA